MAVRRTAVPRPQQSAVASQVIAALGDYLNEDQRKLGATLSLREDLGLDSLAIIELLYRIEEAFNLSFPDEDGSNARFRDPAHVIACGNSALAHNQFVDRDALCQPASHVQGGDKGRQIPVVDPYQQCLGETLEHEIQLAFVMHFDQDIEAEFLASQVIVIDELRAVQRGHDEQYRIRKIRPRLIELELVYHEL